MLLSGHACSWSYNGADPVRIIERFQGGLRNIKYEGLTAQKGED